MKITKIGFEPSGPAKKKLPEDGRIYLVIVGDIRNEEELRFVVGERVYGISSKKGIFMANASNEALYTIIGVVDGMNVVPV